MYIAYHKMMAYYIDFCYSSVTHSRIIGVSLTGISLSYGRRIKAYVLRSCDVCMAYEVYA